MKIAILAPPGIQVPPPGYGGIEQVVELLSQELVRRGHEVTMYAAPGSRSPADVKSPLEESHPDEIQLAIYKPDHGASAFDSIDEAERPFDVVHDHCGFAALALANRLETPLVHTLRPQPSPGLAGAEESRGRAVIGNPIVVDDFPFRADKPRSASTSRQ